MNDSERNPVQKAPELVSGVRAAVSAAADLAGCVDIDCVFRRAVEIILRRLDVERCAIFQAEGDQLRGTYGTNIRREIVDERSQAFSINEVWLSRIRALESGGQAWALVDEPQFEWHEGRPVQVGEGWIAITPIFIRDELIGLIVNDTALSKKPVDPILQEVLSVFASLIGTTIAGKRAEDQLATERNLLRTVIDSLPDYIYFKDAESRLVLDNLAHARVAQLNSPDDVVGKNDFDLFPAEMAAEYFADDQAVIASGVPLINREERGIDSSGNPTWVLTTKVPLRDQSGKVTGIVGLTRDITLLKEVQAALRRSNDELEERVQKRVQELATAEADLRQERNLLRTLIDILPDQIYVKDLKSRFVLANQNCAEIIGVASADELIGRSDADFYPPELAERFAEDERLVTTTGQSLISREEVNINKDGVRRWFLTTKVPLRGGDGQISGIVGISRDITERKEAERLLRQSEERFSKAFNTMPLAISITSLNTDNFIDANARYLEMMGCTREELIGRTAHKMGLIGNPEHEARLRELMNARQPIRDFDTELVTLSGGSRDVSLSVELIDVDGEPCVLGMVQDITERKRAERALVEERTLLRTLIDVLPDYIFAKDREGRFMLSNIAHARAAGRADAHAFMGTTALDLFPRELAAQYEADDRDVVENGRRLISVERATLDDKGKTIYVSTTKVPLIDASGDIIGLVGISRDITEKRRTEDVLRQSEERYRSLFELSPDGIFVYQNECITFVNAAAVRLLRANSSQDLIGRRFDAFLPEDDPVPLEMLEATLDESAPVSAHKTTLRTLDGDSVEVEIVAARVAFAGGIGIQMIVRDISERQRAELAQRESERLRDALEKERELRDLKSKLMVTISHEFRTPMAIAQSSADLLEEYFDRMPPEKRRAHLVKIIDQIRSLTEMMEDIGFIVQASFEDLTLRVEPVDLYQLCSTISGEMQMTGRFSHQIAFEAEEGIPVLDLDLRRIKYVITNLISNAIKYSPLESTVWLDLSRVGGQVVIQVRDEGIGIAPEDQAHIFEPFYRGQNVGAIRGTGIGLSIVKEIVDLHQGTIRVDSALGRGTSFTIKLPITEASQVSS